MLNKFKIIIKVAFRHFKSKIDPVGYLRGIGVKVGENCKIFSLAPGAMGSEPYLVSLGDSVIITQGVRFITHDGSTFLFRKEHPDLDVMGPITIGNNVFIGMNSVIMPGVTVGDNCVIGAMSLVSKSIPAGSVVAGNPAKVIMSIDDFKSKLLERNCGTGELDELLKKESLMGTEVYQDSRGRTWKKYYNENSVKK
ncbi:acyltransferase [Pseudoalteromonas luteoviolacea]|uniref:acyltransferase n=1 Tax=Pseudoalteromonas luteoviolacea TaxID=43657 RepID=UPI001B38A826|nr:acyltransferase [Pseudoalteromonas luteoviolacea]MBQ4812044.1 acyltransferase [Pseudoalteromonas luteoviolacea]